VSRARAVAAIVLFAALAACAKPPSVSDSEMHGVLDWAMNQNVKAGTTVSVALPPGIVGIPVAKPVTISALADGRYCVLLKTQIGWKDNFEGVLSCSGPVRSAEVATPPANENRSAYVSLPANPPLDELYIRDRRDERTYDVYFDLN
jgi:hypothetical protein